MYGISYLHEWFDFDGIKMKENIPVPWIVWDIMNTTILKVLIEERNLHSSKPFFNLATLGWFMNLLPLL